jgi:septal ring factor EnvC (AmiA/AmiB activator)
VEKRVENLKSLSQSLQDEIGEKDLRIQQTEMQFVEMQEQVLARDKLFDELTAKIGEMAMEKAASEGRIMELEGGLQSSAKHAAQAQADALLLTEQVQALVGAVDGAQREAVRKRGESEAAAAALVTKLDVALLEKMKTQG